MSAEDAFQHALRHHRQGNPAAAKAAYERCLALDPHHPHALANLGSLYRTQGLLEPALALCRQAVERSPDDAGMRYNLANALRDAGDLTAAEAGYRAALALKPDDPTIAYNLALLLAQMHRPSEAMAHYRQVLAAQPDHQNARLNLGVLLGHDGRVTEARDLLTPLLTDPEYAAAAINNLAGLMKETGQLDAAIPWLERAIQLQPDLPQPRSNLLMALQYHPTASQAALLAKAREWGAWALSRVSPDVNPPLPEPRAEGALRVGYVSADLCMHPVGLFLKAVIAHHDAARVTPVIYANGGRRDEVFLAIAAAARAKGGDVHAVEKLDDGQLAERIRRDRIDLLVDLAGHSGHSRLAVFAWRPAPLQIAWLGYFATTGLPTIDFVILDPFHAPPGAESQFTETLIRLPHNRFCYTPVSFAPEVAPPPFEKTGLVTFGSFNNTGKLNDAVLAVWARILAAVPGSRLILKWRTFADPVYSQRIRAFFVARGIEAERLDLRPMSVHRELLEQYADIDIALDPFPFSGGHTSCEAMWMGVPVVTLPQARVVSRQTWSFLNNIGLPELAASDPEHYVRLAVELANRHARRAELRGTLRERMRASPLCDAAGFTRSLEAAYGKAWAAAVERGRRHAPSVASAIPPEPAPPAFLASLRSRNEALRAALEQDPDQPELWLELADQMASLFHHEAALACADEALQRRPDDAQALNLKGNALQALGRYEQALACHRQVLEWLPELAGAHANCGVAEQSLGRYDAAIKAFETAVRLDAGQPIFWSNLAASLTYSANHDSAEVLAALRRFDARLAQALWDPRPHANDRNPGRRLRVGYVSPDFRKHSVAYFALPLIEGHRAEAVEVFCYSNHRQQDEWTQAFRRASDHWCDCLDMSDAELAERIRADGIDVLVDLTGHTQGHRLLTFARKPAPVQVTWMGYVTTTGLAAMDWRVTHADADPPGTEAHYSERLWRLPGSMWCWRPLPDMPEVSPPPFRRKGQVTFGAFNRYSKNGLPVLEAWASILSRVPDSRLLMCVPEGEIRQQMAAFFRARGIDPARIDGFAKVSHEDFWALHAEVDIALDPFPFGGGTTTCETLWLGVPLVTCTGREGGDFAPRFASRMGYAFLSNLGLPELAAASIAEYIEIAVALAQEPERLKVLRQTLRPRMAAAPLTDAARFVREMEAAYRAMWQDWRHRSSTDANPNMTHQMTFLHIGCGPKYKDRTTPGFNTDAWREVRLDIDPTVAPDVVGSMLDMAAVASGSVDAIFSSHNIEHLYPHEVSVALAEFRRVLTPEGFVVITCPDLQSVCALIAEDKLTDPAYTSSAGPIAPLDILYGHRPALAAGNLYMAHRCGFTERVLVGTLRAHGFASVASRRRGHPFYDLWAAATVAPRDEIHLRALAADHIPAG